MQCQTGLHGKCTAIGKEAEGMAVRHGQGPLFWFQLEGMAEAGTSGKLVHFNVFSQLLDVGTDCFCLVPGCGVIKTAGPIKRVGGNIDFGLVALPMEGTLTGKYFATSRTG